MKTVAKYVVLAVLAIGLVGCGSNAFVCNPGVYHSDKVITVDLQLDPEPVVVKEPQVVKIREKVLFDFDSYKLDAEASDIVNKVADLMNQYPDTLLALEGHTDKYGSNNYNQILSENRADAVEDALIKCGIDSGRIVSVEGFGKTKLIPNLTNRENRRVLILSVGDK